MKFYKSTPSILCGILLSACSQNFTDSRDGQKYNITQIGNQIWMAENLNFKTAESFCPDGSNSNCSRYGRLYTWNAALSACPEGWRFPTSEDFSTLLAAAGTINGAEKSGKILKAKNGWFKKGNGTDDLDFAAVPAGYMAAAENTERSADMIGKFDGIGGYAYFWSSTTDPNEPLFAQYLFLDFSSSIAIINSFDKNSARSVRCIKK